MTDFEKYSIVFSGIVTLSTIASLWLNYKLTKEARLTREHKDTPDINIRLKRAEADPSSIFIVFENIGLGYAKNVNFKIIKDFSYYDHEMFELRNKGIILNKVNNFYPRQNFEYFITSLLENYDEKIKETITLEIEYENIFFRKYHKIINLDFREFAGELIINPPPHYLGRVAYELKEIKKTLNAKKK